MKRCSICNIPKQNYCYHKDASSKTGRRSSCKDCNKSKTKDYYHKNKVQCLERKKNWVARNIDKVIRYQKEYRKTYTRSEHSRRDSWLKSQYKVSADKYADLCLMQNNLCLICLRPEQTGKYLSVDHDHSNGLVRGLLCKKCNTLIAFARESKTILDRAIKYLEAEDE